MFCRLKKENNISCSCFKKSWKAYYFNDSKWRRIESYQNKKLPALLTEIMPKHLSDFY